MTGGSPQIRNELAGAIDGNDGLLVTRLKNEAAWRMLDYDKNSEMTDWLMANIRHAA